MGECLFCAIVSGDIPCTQVHEDAFTLGFLDINPLARGHALIIPKHHAAKLEDVPADVAGALMHAAQRLSARLCAATGATDSTIAINNGPDAGQEVGHVHVHVIPRRPGDAGGPVHALFSQRPTADPDEMEAIAKQVLA